jgi:hypothetical protein
VRTEPRAGAAEHADVAANRTPDVLCRELANTPVTLRVERFCSVTGQHPAASSRSNATCTEET